MDGASDEAVARKQEHLQRLSEAVGERGRAYFCGGNGYEWEIEWFVPLSNKDPYTGLNPFTYHETLETALDYVNKYGSNYGTNKPPTEGE
jgi:hypothetical protein